MNPHFSFIILTLNEEQHLPRLLDSIASLNASTFVLDSGSTDQTKNIVQKYNAELKIHEFENHPKQWDFAINNFQILTPWIIGLDADQIVTPELLQQLQEFKDEDYLHVNGIYFNRKNFFKGQWIKYGGFYPKYLLKMFRKNVGYSDLNENMDHRFIVSGETVIWKKGHILEENLKENQISFWIEKHNRYSDLVAQEEVERLNYLREHTIKPNFFGSPDQKNAYLKKLWWKLPLGLRPFLYFTYRLIYKLGILDGSKGILFHFLQGFWFRLMVDVKIKEIMKSNQKNLPPI